MASPDRDNQEMHHRLGKLPAMLERTAELEETVEGENDPDSDVPPPFSSDFSGAAHLPNTWVPPHSSHDIPSRHPHRSLIKYGVH